MIFHDHESFAWKIRSDLGQHFPRRIGFCTIMCCEINENSRCGSSSQELAVGVEIRTMFFLCHGEEHPSRDSSKIPRAAMERYLRPK